MTLTFTVKPARRPEVTFESRLSDEQVREHLKTSSSRFGRDLADKYPHGWSGKQRVWAHYLASLNGTAHTHDHEQQAVETAEPSVPAVEPQTETPAVDTAGLGAVAMRKLVVATLTDAQRSKWESYVGQPVGYWRKSTCESALKDRECAHQPAKRAGHNQTGVTTADVERMVAKAVAKLAPQPRTVEVRRPDGTTVNVGDQHRQFEEVLQVVMACGQVWIAGPAGSGKTTLAHGIAEAMGLPFYHNGAIDSPYKLSGFIDAQGRIIKPQFRQAYENGGVYLFDEVDGSMPAAVLAFNAALSNGDCDFPDGRVKRHPDFYCIAAANTFGHGATDEYVGRMKQDAAFLDRFPVIYLDCDERLEASIADNKMWVGIVQKCRKVARDRGLKVIISPRASIFGTKLLAAGMNLERVIEIALKKAMSKDHWEIIRREAGI